MSRETTTGTEEPREASIASACAKMMATICGGGSESVDCENILSQFLPGEEIPQDWLTALAACCAGPAEA